MFSLLIKTKVLPNMHRHQNCCWLIFSIGLRLKTAGTSVTAMAHRKGLPIQMVGISGHMPMTSVAGSDEMAEGEFQDISGEELGCARGMSAPGCGQTLVEEWW